MPFLDTRAHGADHSTIAELQCRMEKLLDELDKGAEAYAKACQVCDFVGDRRKTILADAFVVVQSNDSECSATAAEHRARSLQTFKEAMKQLTTQHLNAETVKANYHILQTRLDVARTFLTVERTKLERGL